MRLKPSEVKEETLTLEDLIPRYALNKSELDSYKKLVDKDNAEIKKQMKEAKKLEFEAGGYVAKYIVVNHDSLNEAKLMEVIKKHNIEGVIKTKEYIDMDALESYLYKTELDKKTAAEFDSCRENSQTVQLRVSPVKKKKEDEE